MPAANRFVIAALLAPRPGLGTKDLGSPLPAAG
jgi:hypothetical protein